MDTKSVVPKTESRKVFDRPVKPEQKLQKVFDRPVKPEQKLQKVFDRPVKPEQKLQKVFEKIKSPGTENKEDFHSGFSNQRRTDMVQVVQPDVVQPVTKNENVDRSEFMTLFCNLLRNNNKQNQNQKTGNSIGDRVGRISIGKENTTIEIGCEAFQLFIGGGRLDIVRRLIVHNPDRSTDMMSEILVTVPGQNPLCLTIVDSKFKKGLRSLLEDYVPALCINTGIPSFQTNFNHYSTILYRQAQVLPIGCVYMFSGWENVNGRWVYLQGGLPNVKADFVLPPFTSGQAMAGLSTMLKLVGNNPALYVLFVFSHIGYIARLFKKAGYSTNFIALLLGKTGALKTTLLKLLGSCQFKANHNDCCRFNSTIAALDVKIMEYQDALLLIDDLHPANTRKAENEMNEKLEHLIRTFGDGELRKKVAEDRKTPIGGTICGAAWMTAEYENFQNLSDRLRCLVIDIGDKDVDSSIVSVLQKQPQLTQAYYSSYIHFLESNFAYVTEFIAAQMDIRRTQWSGILQTSHYRLIDIAAMLNVLNDIIWEAAAAYGFADVGRYKAYGQECLNNFFATVVAKVQNSDPKTVYLGLVAEAYAHSEFHFAKNAEAFKTGGGDGYEENGLVVLDTTSLGQIIVKLAKLKGSHLERLTREELVAAGIVEAKPERMGSGKRQMVYAFRQQALLTAQY